MTLFSLKLDVQAPFEVFRASPVQLAERVLKDVVPTEMEDDVVSPEAVVNLLQFLAEVATLDVEVENSDVVDEDGKGAVRQGNCGLTEYLVQYSAVLLCVRGEERNTL